MPNPWEQFFEHTAAPANYPEVSGSVSDWVQRHAALHRKMALVTSGGTTVPLERNTVRFVDNFSIGTRGASSCEYFLQQGYAVVFLHRDSSVQPFVRHLRPQIMLDAFVRAARDDARTPAGDAAAQQTRNQKQEEDDDRLTLSLDQTTSRYLRPVLQQYSTAVAEDRLLALPFNSLSSYLWILRMVALTLQQHSSPRPALLYLAAAVADFYIPYEELSEHKLQSSSGPLSVELQLVPKMMAPLVALWAPSLYIVSFKLETDSTKLTDKAQAALIRYRHHLVVGNLLQTRRDEVILVEPQPSSPDTAAGGTQPTDAAGAVSASQDSHGEQVVLKRLKLTEQQKQSNQEIEKVIVEEICLKHNEFLEKVPSG